MESILPEYLYWCIMGDSFRDEAKKSMTGTSGLKRIPRAIIENFQIPLPPLPEQEKIVAKLDQAFASIDEARGKAEQSLADTRELWESTLEGIFTTGGADWEEKILEDIVSDSCTL